MEVRTKIRCNCGLPMMKRTSWTHQNPGRKFFACKMYNHESGQKGCDSFEWIDEKCVDWQRDVTNLLLAEKEKMAADMNILKGRLLFMEKEKGRLEEELQKLRKKTSRKTE